MMSEILFGVDQAGNPIPFSFQFVSADQRRKKGGEIINVEKCIYQQAKHRNTSAVHRDKLNEITGYTPSMASGTKTVHTQPGNRPIRICPRLITEFNGKRVIY